MTATGRASKVHQAAWKTKRWPILGRNWKHQQEEEAGRLPEDVPKGHFAVYVGERRSRFIGLKWPEFQRLLREAEEEFGFARQTGGLVIPCEVVVFRSLTSVLR